MTHEHVVHPHALAPARGGAQVAQSSLVVITTKLRRSDLITPRVEAPTHPLARAPLFDDDDDEEEEEEEENSQSRVKHVLRKLYRRELPDSPVMATRALGRELERDIHER